MKHSTPSRSTLIRSTCAILAAAATAAVAQTKPAATDVPVKQVVLFSSGVGYFQHDGTVHGNGSTELHFKTGQINDILKSLVLQDTGGGRVGVITYPSQDPVEKTLKSFQIDITGNPSLSDLFGQLRGARVTVTVATEKTSGIILGVEKKRKPAEKGEPIETPVLNLMTDSGLIVSYEFDSIRGLSLDDAQLQQELTKALTTLNQSRDQDKKPVTINFNGAGDRAVEIGYVVETPIWKTSYRLILPDEKNQDKARKPSLQGWAIVENQTDNDWNNVDLSLVSGRPISFVMNLYSPLYIPRPVVTPELYASLKPQTYADAIADAKDSDSFDAPVAAGAPLQQKAANMALRRELRDAAGGAVNARFGARSMAGAGENSQLDSLSRSIDPTASVTTMANATANIGDLFEYNVGSVTLPRQKSAMLPIITDNIEVERVSIYNAAVMPRNPLTGARVNNTTGKSLMQGPITVLDSGTYAGDAKIDDLPPGANRLLSYGVDLQMTVDSEHADNQNVVLSGKIVKGVLWVQRKNTHSQDYVAQNKADHDKTLIIEAARMGGDWKLIDPVKPDETTPTLYRFKGSVAAHKSTKLTVKQEVIQSESIALLPADMNGLIYWSKLGEIPQKVRDALVKAIGLRQSVTDFERQIEEHNKRVTDIAAEQDRIRNNMNSVNRQGEYYNRLLGKLNDQESQIEKLQSERDDLTGKRDKTRKDLEEYLSNLDVE